ncbi:DUF4293 family protein [Prolixibacteraceae bacterium JC049]|nr:DUF4293 family protein [Prolixibacteraceae bacterium JC049]
MIQRIQTFFLAVSFLLISIMFTMPLIEFVTEAGDLYQFTFKGLFKLNAEGMELVENNWAITGMLGLIVLMHGVIIASFKHRVRQMRLTVFTIFLLVGFFAIGFYMASSYADMVNGQHSFTIGTIFPIVAIILDALAIRAIGRDEALVRSVDRIR